MNGAVQPQTQRVAVMEKSVQIGVGLTPATINDNKSAVQVSVVASYCHAFSYPCPSSPCSPPTRWGLHIYSMPKGMPPYTHTPTHMYTYTRTHTHTRINMVAFPVLRMGAPMCFWHKLWIRQEARVVYAQCVCMCVLCVCCVCVFVVSKMK